MRIWQLLLCLVWALPATGVTRFIDGSSDIPLMDTLKDTTTDMSFDTPEGRLLVRNFSGTPTFKEIQIFYRASLPNMGWVEEPSDAPQKLAFKRGSERLVITQSGGTVTFQLTPALELI